MKLCLLFLCSSVLLAGCQVTPNTSDTTNAVLRFRVHYQTPALGSPNVEIVTSTSTQANACLYVATPFGVGANATDSGGIRSITLGPSALFTALNVRQLSGDTLAVPSPTETTQGTGSDIFPNPGTPAMSSLVQVNYSQGKAFDQVTLMGTYEFANGATLAALRGTVRNFGAPSGVSEVYQFYVRPATKQPTQQPGMSCPVP